MQSIFSKMTELCMKHGAINLAQGFPDFDVQKDLVPIINSINKENNHQYAPMMGTLELRNGVSKLIQKNYGVSIRNEDILITSGATEGLFSSFMGLIERGDEVLIFDPCYDSYVPAIKRAGGVPVRIALEAPDFNYDWEKIKLKVTSKTRFLVLNNPHNPLGKVLDKAAFNALKLFVLAHDLTLISDEVYEFISYTKHYSVLLDEELRARSVVLSSFGKTLHLTGWKIGYLSAPEHLLQKIANIHQFIVFSVHRSAQMAIADYLELKNHDVSPLTDFIPKKELIRNHLEKSRFKLLDCDGTYFQTLDYSAISDLSDVEFCEWMVKEKGVGAIPISVFYESGLDQKLIRLCFAKKDETLIQALDILCQI